MNNIFLILLVGFLYIVLFGGLSLMRREGLSNRFAAESVVLTLIFAGLAFLFPDRINPVLFMIVIYLVTMRVRLLVDVAIFFARRGNFSTAETIYQLAGRIWPDATGRMIIAVNQGVMEISRSNLDKAILIIRNVLAAKENGHLGINHEAAAHYNLGVAYLKKEMPLQATNEFRTVLDIWPASIYARRAEAALNKDKERSQQQ